MFLQSFSYTPREWNWEGIDISICSHRNYFLKRSNIESVEVYLWKRGDYRYWIQANYPISGKYRENTRYIFFPIIQILQRFFAKAFERECVSFAEIESSSCSPAYICKNMCIIVRYNIQRNLWKKIPSIYGSRCERIFREVYII